MVLTTLSCSWYYNIKIFTLLSIIVIDNIMDLNDIVSFHDNFSQHLISPISSTQHTPGLQKNLSDIEIHTINNFIIQ